MIKKDSGKLVTKTNKPDQPTNKKSVELIYANPTSASDITRLTRTIMILLIASVVAITAATVSIYTAVKSKVVAIAVDQRGVVIPVIPLTEPLLSESRVIGFVEECLRRSFSHDFLHFDKTIHQAQECYTDGAADQFVISLQPYIKIMEDKRMVMSVTIPKPPRVVLIYTKKGALNNVIHWDVEALIEVFFEGRSERIPSSRNVVQITVKRVPLEGTPRGVLIDKLSVGPG